MVCYPTCLLSCNKEFVWHTKMSSVSVCPPCVQCVQPCFFFSAVHCLFILFVCAPASVHLLCLLCICCIWYKSGWGPFQRNPEWGSEWSYYDTRHKYLNSSSFCCFSILPCRSPLNQPGFASCCFFSPRRLCFAQFLFVSFSWALVCQYGSM